MHTKTLASGILLVLLVSIVSPLSMGVYLQEQTTIPLVQSSGPMDSPWPMKCHDLNHTGRSPYNTSHITDLEKWRVLSESWAVAGIVIDDNDCIYYGDNAFYLTSVNSDGNPNWRYQTDAKIKSTPALSDDGTIYCSSYDARLHALDLDGNLKWKTGLGGSSTTSPIINKEGIIFVGTFSPGNSVVAVYPNGTISWKFKLGGDVMGDISLGPDDTIYASSYDSNLYAIYPNGSLKWIFNTGDSVKGPTSIYDEDTLLICSWDGYLYSLYQENGSMRWRCDIDSGSETNPSIGPDGIIYMGGEKLYAINPNGTIKWTYSEPGRVIFQSSPAISNDNIIYVGADVNQGNGGEIWAINSDGTLRWKKMIANEYLWSSPAIGIDGTVYISSASIKRNSIDGFRSIGYLHAFGPVESNTAPNKPSISGDKWGEVGETYLYEITTTDDENNPLSFYIDWGDETYDDWSEEAASDEVVKFIHTYNKGGRYTIRVKARDTLGEESDWGTHTVRMPYSYHYPAFSWLMERFPLLLRLLNLLL